MKKIAILTGATGGLGREFLKQMLKEDIHEVWAIARNKEKLYELLIQIYLEGNYDNSLYESINKRTDCRTTKENDK